MVAYRRDNPGIPACCGGRSQSIYYSPVETSQPFASTPSSCPGALPFDLSPSPIVESPEPAFGVDYYPTLTDISGSSGQGWPSTSDDSPYSASSVEQEETAPDETDDSSLYYSALSSPCPEDRAPASAAVRAIPPTPQVWNTPAIQRRNARIRRFNCKRRLTFHDVKEWTMSGTEPLAASEDGELQEDHPPAMMLEYQNLESSPRPADDGCMETILGPLPQHRYVPLWVFMAREQYPEIFQMALTYFFENTGWPNLQEMDQSFQEDCEDVGITPDTYKKTVGFAPVWVFILDVLSRAKKIERKWFDICMDYFFEEGNFPELTTMPVELQDACVKMDVGDYDFYVPDM